MKKEHEKIIKLVSEYLAENPDQRFTQALFNLDINQFQKNHDLRNIQYKLRDPYNDLDKDVISRIEKRTENFGNQKNS